MRACMHAGLLREHRCPAASADAPSLLSRAVESLQTVVSEAGSSGSADALHLDLQSFK